MLDIMLLMFDVPPKLGGGDMGGGGTWYGLGGSAPCLWPYMFVFIVGVELGVDWVAWEGGDRGVGLFVRDFGGGGGRGGPEFETGKGGRGLAGGRAGGGKRTARFVFVNFESVGEPRDETGESGPLAVFALRLEPADEGADKKFWFCGLCSAG